MNLIISEFDETRRKFGWKLFFEQNPPTKSSNFVRYKKGSWPADVYTKQLDKVFEQTAFFQNLVLEQYHRVRIPKQFTSSYWRRILESMTTEGRFLQCDKNLGIRLVSEDIYSRLAERESKNYRYIEDIGLRDEAMKEMIERFGVVTAAVNNAIPIKTGKRGASNDQLSKKILTEVADFMHFTVRDKKDFSFPRLRLLLKVHKAVKADGLYPVRPIVPNWGLPSYGMAKWLGAFMAKMLKSIPWNLESTDQFLCFIKDKNRNEKVSSFDFTNLYGNEPVAETLSLFFDALTEWQWTFQDEHDRAIFDALMTPVSIPESLCYANVFRCGGSRQTYVFCLLLAECIFCTIAELDLGHQRSVFVSTADFLAMGCPPVAPLSVISLAVLEARTLGFERCSKGMRRLIDDIIIDESIISEEELRSVYPSYLELNHGEKGHFLDVSYVWVGNRFMTYPYIKPFTTIPLNIHSCHPFHVLRATAKNELSRLMKLCSEEGNKNAWSTYWYTKYKAAGYSWQLLRRIEFEIRRAVTRIHPKKPKELHHVETFVGTDTSTSRLLCSLSRRPVAQTWRVCPSLLSMALKAHDRNRKLSNNNTNSNDENICDRTREQLSFSFTFGKGLESPEDGWPVRQPKSFGK